MKTGMICHIRGSNDDCRVIGTRFDCLLFQTEMSENCYTLFFSFRISWPSYTGTHHINSVRIIVTSATHTVWRHREIVHVPVVSGCNGVVVVREVDDDKSIADVTVFILILTLQYIYYYKHSNTIHTDPFHWHNDVQFKTKSLPNILYQTKNENNYCQVNFRFR